MLFAPYAAVVRTKPLARESEPAVVAGIASGEGRHAAERAQDFTINKRSARKKLIVKEISPDQKVGAAEPFFVTLLIGSA